MSRVLLGGDRPRFFDDNGRPFTKPARLVFTDGLTSLPKQVYYGATGSTGATIVDLVDAGYVPVSGLWLDVGTYNMALQLQVTADPETWTTLWTLLNIPGAVSESGDTDSFIAFYKTVAEIRLATIKSGICFNTGYYQMNDGGQGAWRWLENSIEDDDGGAYLLPTGQSASVPGRWARIMPSNGVVSIGMWGATTAMSDCSGNIRNALLWCSRLSDQTGTTLEFPAGTFNIGNAVLNIDNVGQTSTGAVSKKVCVILRQSFRFAGTGTINFSVPTVIEAKEPIAETAVNLVFLNGSNVKEIEATWGANYTRSASYAIASNIGLRFSVSDTVSVPVGSFGSPVPCIVISDNCKITVGAYTFSTTTLIVEGQRRKAITVSGLTPAIGNSIIEAWWFGYGVETTADHTALLSTADSIAQSNNSILHIELADSNATVGTYIIQSPLILDGFIRVIDGESLRINNLYNNPISKIFEFSGVSSIANVLNPFVNPAWYGMSYTQTPTRNKELWGIMCNSIETWQTINGFNAKYYVDPELYTPYHLIAKNIRFSLESSSDGNIFNSTNVFYFDLENCEFTGYSANPFDCVNVQTSIANAFVRVKNCKSHGGLSIGCTGVGGQAILDGNVVSSGYTSVINSLYSSAVVRKSNCYNSMIRAIAASNNFGNILIEGNRLRGATQLECDIQIWTTYANTTVKNVNITGNNFEWTGTAQNLILINQWAYGGGSFSDWQDVHVGENTIVSSHEISDGYPDLGDVNGPFVSSTSGSDVVLFDQATVSNVPIDLSSSKLVRIGPMFLGNHNLASSAGSHISAISGEFYCQQTDFLNGDGVVVYSSDFFVLVPSSNPETNGRFYEALANVKYRAESSSSEFTFWVRPRAIIKWGDRCDIGRYSKVY